MKENHVTILKHSFSREQYPNLQQELELVDHKETGDYCPHLETGIIPSGVQIAHTDIHGLFEQAQRHHARGCAGSALAFLKVIDQRAVVFPQGFTELCQEIDRQIGRSGTWSVRTRGANA